MFSWLSGKKKLLRVKSVKCSEFKQPLIKF